MVSLNSPSPMWVITAWGAAGSSVWLIKHEAEPDQAIFQTSWKMPQCVLLPWATPRLLTCLYSSLESSHTFTLRTTSVKGSYPTSLKLHRASVRRCLSWRGITDTVIAPSQSHFSLSLLTMTGFILISVRIPGTGRPFLISVLTSVLIWLALIRNKEKAMV